MRFVLMDPNFLLGNAAAFAVNASGKKAAGIFIVPKTGNIRYVGASFTAISSPPAFDVRLEQADSSTLAKIPNGTLVNAGASATYTPAGTNSFVWTQLGSDGAVTAGDIVAGVIAYPAGGSGSGSVLYQGNSSVGVEAPTSADATSGTWTSRSPYPAISLKYSDGEIIPGFCVSSVTSSGYGSGSNPNERATVFTPPFACNLVGVRGWFGTISSSPVSLTVNLYTGTSTTPTLTFTPASNPFLANASWCHIPLPATALTANQQYRLSLKATSVNQILTYRCLFPSTAERDALFGPFSSDTRNGSSWVGEVTTTTEMFGPVVDATVFGGGVLVNPGMDGGMT